MSSQDRKESKFQETGLPGPLLEIMEIFEEEWGEYIIDDLTHLQKTYLKEALKEIIQQSLPEFKEEITEKDIAVYNDIIWKSWGIVNSANHAAQVGSMNLVNYYISLGARNFNELMARAAFGGYIEIVQMMLDKGADNFDRVMEVAAEEGYIEIVQMMLDRGANFLYVALKNAASEGHQEIVELLKNRLKIQKEEYMRTLDDG